MVARQVKQVAGLHSGNIPELLSRRHVHQSAMAWHAMPTEENYDALAVEYPCPLGVRPGAVQVRLTDVRTMLRCRGRCQDGRFLRLTSCKLRLHNAVSCAVVRCAARLQILQVLATFFDPIDLDAGIGHNM